MISTSRVAIEFGDVWAGLAGAAVLDLRQVAYVLAPHGLDARPLVITRGLLLAVSPNAVDESDQWPEAVTLRMRATYEFDQRLHFATPQ